MPEIRPQFDVCVIGTGAGGAPAAAALAAKGLRVAVIERGSDIPSQKLRKDEFAVCRRPLFRPAGTRGIREVIYGDAKPVIADHLWAAIGVGGGTRIMSGFFFRMQPEDFSPLSRFGSLPDAAHRDWPIGYDDLAPYYDRATADIGVTDSASVIHKSVLLPPLKTHPVSGRLDAACNDLGVNTIITPRAVLSKDVADRGECSYSGFCGSYACLTGAKGSMYETYMKSIQGKSNVTIFTDSYVYKLETHGGTISRALFFDGADIPRSLTARIFIVACGAIETARLLLNSKNPDFPHGLANTSDQVGKNLTFTMPCEVTGFFPKHLFPAPAESSSPFVQRSTQDFHLLNNPELRYKRGGTVVFLFPHPNPIQRVLQLSYGENGSRILGLALKDRIREYFSYNHLQTDTFIDFLPNDRTRTEISHSVKDHWGIPSARIFYRPHEENMKASRHMALHLTDIFSRMGAVGVQVNPSPFTAGELQHGTCRFGEDPKTAVLDPWCRSHDIRNLYITDASFMCSGLPVPSTFTIIANSLRVAEHVYRNG